MMTRQRYDGHSTEFGLWLRQQTEIDSRLGFVATNVDFVWKNYKTGQWMFLEEKRHGARIRWWQQQLFTMIDQACKDVAGYQGFHVLTFENTNPEDGRVYLDYKEITKTQLVQFLHFEMIVPSLAWQRN